MKNIIESIRDYIKTCPYLEDFEGAIKVGIDYLDSEATTYSIERTPCNPIVKRYVDGASLRQEQFILCSRESYGQDIFNNLDNINFYDNFANWIEKNNKNQIFPKLEGNKESIKLEVTTNGYAFQTDIDKAQYQIQLKLTYFQRED